MNNTMRVVIAVLFLTTVSQAALIERQWSSTTVYAPNYFVLNLAGGMGALPIEQYDGYGWQVDIALAGSHPLDTLVEHAGTDGMFGWYDGYGFAIEGFRFLAMEGEEVVMRIFNSTDINTAWAYMDSLPVLLPDLDDRFSPSPSELEVIFEFIPEPSSALLLMTGAGGILFYRRAKRRQQDQQISRRRLN